MRTFRTINYIYIYMQVQVRVFMNSSESFKKAAGSTPMAFLILPPYILFRACGR